MCGIIETVKRTYEYVRGKLHLLTRSSIQISTVELSAMHVPGPMVQVEEEASCMWAEWPDFQLLWYGHRASVEGTLNGAKKKWKCHFLLDFLTAENIITF